MSEWHIYRKDASEPHDDIVAEGRLPDPPTWRDFRKREEHHIRGRNYRPSDYEVEMVNTALFLRRPLLITGNPGSGKSSLAYSVAWQLNLGSVLWWPINSRSTLHEGLYNYDAMGRLRDLNIEKIESERDGDKKKRAGEQSSAERIGRYIRLGPLGTALYSGPKPRVLLIDEIDKSDVDLPNDLLHVLEEGRFDIPELQRLTPEEADDEDTVSGKQYRDTSITVNVFTHDENVRSKTVPIVDGRVHCERFPFVVMTSNGERELPPAFKRRCLILDIDDPEGERLREIVMAHVEEAGGVKTQEAGREDNLVLDVGALIRDFEEQREKEGALLATDQLLNAVYLITREKSPHGDERTRILKTVLRELGRK